MFYDKPPTFVHTLPVYLLDGCTAIINSLLAKHRLPLLMHSTSHFIRLLLLQENLPKPCDITMLPAYAWATAAVHAQFSYHSVVAATAAPLVPGCLLSHRQYFQFS
jgi:hypothetical protein